MTLIKTYDFKNRDELLARIKDQKITTGITVGRRQPMHIGHLDCVREIIHSGITNILFVIGSNNIAESDFYDAARNPLTFDQQVRQIQYALTLLGQEMPEMNTAIDYKIVGLSDMGDMNAWAEELRELVVLSGFVPERAIYHYRSKVEDINNPRGLAKSESEILAQNISVWRSYNQDMMLNFINSTEFRLMDLEGEEFRRKSKQLVHAELIRHEAKRAREESPDPDVQLLAHLPLTMMFLTLEKMRQDKQIFLKSIINIQNPPRTSFDLWLAVSKA